jgi:pimeloyl-ACP methyl ester carboxylesterase
MLFAWGAHDVTATPEVLVQTLVQTHPGRKHLIIPATGHWVQYEAAAPINQALVEWFSPGKAD